MNRRKILLVTAAIPAAGVLARSGPAAAAPWPEPPISVAVEPLEAGSVAYAPLAPEFAGAPGGGKLVVRLRVTNTGTEVLNVTGITFSFPGSSVPNKIMQGVDLLFDVDVDDDGTKDGPEFQPGQSKWWSNGGVTLADDTKVKNQVYLPTPIPSSVTIQITCDGYLFAYQVTLPLTPYKVSHRLPIDVADLRPGECLKSAGDHWATGGAAGSQIYAHDVGVVGWDGAKWTSLLPGKDGTANEHFRGWNVPIRTVADGTVWAAVDGMADNTVLGSLPVPTPDPVGGNSVWIAHPDGTMTWYTHLRNGTVTVQQGDTVVAGQILGRLGNSGNSSGPHIHLETRRRSDTLRNPLRPMLFKDAWLLEMTQGTPWDPDSNLWVPALNRALPPKEMLIWPSGWHPTWYPRGKAELVLPGIRSTDYQTVFNRATEAGYRPVWVDAHEVGTQVFFNLIMRPEDGVPWVAKHGMDGTAYQNEYDLMREQGYRLINVTSYVDSGVRYAAVWRKQGGPELRAYHGWSAAAHSTEYAKLVAAGYHPVNISVVAPGDTLKYTALYLKENVGVFEAPTFLDAAGYQDAWNTNTRAGRHLVYLNAYQYAGSYRFSAVFQQYAAGSGGTAGQHHLDANALTTVLETRAQAGMLTRVLAGYNRGGTANYGAGWRRA
ncbi:peptidoglycan DD-metalloendopeptidase family protein [Micromonospora echinofusca]|uniref:Peptidoglycan DD-metalloendopeptidase family protein n=1 Tax=Micromonospora echinofusca TaxID=47858 RepID=A0ABS3VKS0_MICEH|nr:peptidoglycan DD-metalloendopeptidase family protein [Micromonospora echinofusca]MBO4205122.1 peptidoglycan DD-metalloendopeptidase family protein [Micromonospora echinofusca]